MADGASYPQLRKFLLELLEKHTLATDVQLVRGVSSDSIEVVLLNGQQRRIILPFTFHLEDFEGTVGAPGHVANAHRSALTFSIFIDLGRAGLLPRTFRITPEFVGESRDWQHLDRVTTRLEESLREDFLLGLGRLQTYLRSEISQNPDLPLVSLRSDLDRIAGIIAFLKNGQLNDSLSSHTLGFLKASVVVQLIELEERRQTVNDHVRLDLDKKLFGLAARLRENEFLETQLPEWFNAFYASKGGIISQFVPNDEPSRPFGFADR